MRIYNRNSGSAYEIGRLSNSDVTLRDENDDIIALYNLGSVNWFDKTISALDFNFWQQDVAQLAARVTELEAQLTDVDYCPTDPEKTEPGVCGCGTSDVDTDGDGIEDCNDICPGFDDTQDADADGTPDGCDNCPTNPTKTEPDVCGCGGSFADRNELKTAVDTYLIQGCSDSNVDCDFCTSGDGYSKYGCPIGNWCTSLVTDMSELFYADPDYPDSTLVQAKENFNDQLESWDVSNVVNMFGMFDGAEKFNQPIQGWNVSQVANMKYMFDGASAFSQHLCDWFDISVRGPALTSWGTESSSDVISPTRGMFKSSPGTPSVGYLGHNSVNDYSFDKSQC